MAMISSSVQCADGNLGQHRHVCAFFNDLDEEQRVLRSFFKEGFDRGEKATHILEADKREDYLRRARRGRHKCAGDDGHRPI
jgi:hypothetical protein